MCQGSNKDEELGMSSSALWDKLLVGIQPLVCVVPGDCVLTGGLGEASLPMQ